MIFYWTTIGLCLTLATSLVWMQWWHEANSDKLNAIQILLGEIMSNQEHLDADVAALTAAAAAIAGEIAALKAQPAAEALDFTGLDNVVATFQGLVPAEPVPAEPGATGGVE